MTENPDRVGVDHVRCGCGETSLTVTRNTLSDSSVTIVCPICGEVIEMLTGGPR